MRIFYFILFFFTENSLAQKSVLEYHCYGICPQILNRNIFVSNNDYWFKWCRKTCGKGKWSQLNNILSKHDYFAWRKCQFLQRKKDFIDPKSSLPVILIWTKWFGK